MAVEPVCIAPHAALGSLAQPVTRFSDELHVLVEDLLDTMRAHRGVGLAATQMGHALQVFVASFSLDAGRELVVVNPALEWVSGRTAVVEGCLSLPNVWERVSRWAAVRLRGQDPFGRPLCIEADGLLAVVIQHEIDHLHGLLLTDRRSLTAPRDPPSCFRKKAGGSGTKSLKSLRDF